MCIRKGETKRRPHFSPEKISYFLNTIDCFAQINRRFIKLNRGFDKNLLTIARPRGIITLTQAKRYEISDCGVGIAT